MARLKFIFSLLLCSQITFAANETLRMQTVSPNAEMYEKPSYSAKVVGRLRLQTVLLVNPKKFVGSDGIGVFYEAKTSDGKTVYVADAVLAAAPAAKAPVKVVAKSEPSAAPKAPETTASRPVEIPVPRTAPIPVPVVAATPAPRIAEPVSAPRPAPVTQAPAPAKSDNFANLDEPAPAMTEASRRARIAANENSANYGGARPNYFGVNFGMVNYAEMYKGSVYQAPRLSMGLKYSGTFENRWSGYEANLLFSPGAPKFLVDAGAAGSSGGYLAIGDFQFVARFKMSSNLEAKIGAGAGVINSKFNTTMITEPYTSESTRAGALANVGLSYTRPSWAMIFDLRQVMENQSYLGSQISFLFPL